MSTDPSAPGARPEPAGPVDPGVAGDQPSEAELRAAYEAELARITSTDLMLQAAVSLLNVGSYRLMPPRPAGADPSGGGAPGGSPADADATPGAGQDLEQVRDAIDGVRALLEILERRVPSELRPLRDALSQLQMAYAREVQAQGGVAGGEPGAGDPQGSGGEGSSGEGGEGGTGTGGPGGEQPPTQPAPRGPGPAESSGRLWVPGR